MRVAIPRHIDDTIAATDGGGISCAVGPVLPGVHSC
jgi:hypothetical protein